MFSPVMPERAALARRVGAPFDGALLRVALLPLQKEFLPLTAAELADWSCVSCHALL